MTITQQQIIDLAVEAGFNWPEVQTTTIEQRLERFYALAVAKETEARIKLQKEFMEYQNDMQARGTRLIKEAYQRGVRDERDRSADALVAEGVAEYERGLKDGAKLERNACLAEIETGIWMDKTTEEVLAEVAEAIRARSCQQCRNDCGQGQVCEAKT